MPELLHHVRAVKAKVELAARHAGLSDAKLGGSDSHEVADMDVRFGQALHSQVLTKSAERKRHSWKLFGPVVVMLVCVSIDGFPGAAMDCQVGLAIALHVVRNDSPASLDRLLEYRR